MNSYVKSKVLKVVSCELKTKFLSERLVFDLNGFPQEARLLELLRLEDELAEQLRGLTEEQAALLASDDAEAFDKSLDRSRDIIEKIDGLHQESDVLMQSYSSFLSTGDGEKVELVETAIVRIRDTIAECAGQNDANATAAKEKADEYMSQAGNIGIRRKSIGLYGQNASKNPVLFDRKS